MSDIEVSNQGTIFLLYPTTGAALRWLREHTDGTWWGSSLVVEHRYAYPILEYAVEDGMSWGEV